MSKLPLSDKLNFDAVKSTRFHGKKCEVLGKFKTKGEAISFLEDYKRNNVVSRRFPPFIDSLLLTKRRVYEWRVYLPIVK